MRKTFLSIALVLMAMPLAAQQRETRAERFMRNCDRWGDDRRERFCAVRDVTLKTPQRALFVDGRDNGGVTFYGWDKNEVLVRALVQTQADSRSEAEDLAKEIRSKRTATASARTVR